MGVTARLHCGAAKLRVCTKPCSKYACLHCVLQPCLTVANGGCRCDLEHVCVLCSLCDTKKSAAHVGSVHLPLCVPTLCMLSICNSRCAARCVAGAGACVGVQCAVHAGAGSCEKLHLADKSHPHHLHIATTMAWAVAVAVAVYMECVVEHGIQHRTAVSPSHLRSGLCIVAWSISGMTPLTTVYCMVVML